MFYIAHIPWVNNFITKEEIIRFIFLSHGLIFFYYIFLRMVISLSLSVLICDEAVFFSLLLFNMMCYMRMMVMRYIFNFDLVKILCYTTN